MLRKALFVSRAWAIGRWSVKMVHLLLSMMNCFLYICAVAHPYKKHSINNACLKKMFELWSQNS